MIINGLSFSQSDCFMILLLKSDTTVVTFVNLNDLHEFASLIYNTPSRFTRGDLHLSLRFTRLQIYNFSKRQGFDLQLLRRRGPHWFATKQSLCFSESMKAFWGDFALVDNFGKSIVKGLRKEVLFSEELRFKQSNKIESIVKFRTCFALHHWWLFLQRAFE